MCNPEEQAALDYASDPKRNILVSETDNLVICADTTSVGTTSKAIDNQSNGSFVEINEAVVHLSSDSLKEADGGGDHHFNSTSKHPAKEVLISANDGQEEGSSGVITMNCEETGNEIAVGSLEIQQFEQMMQDIIVIAERAETSLPTIATSSKEDAADHVPRSFKEVEEETPSEIEQDIDVIAERVETSIPTTAMSSREDAAEHVPRSFKEADEEAPSEIEQEGVILSSVQVQATDTLVLNGNSQPELAEFFSNARGSKLEKEIEEQEYAPSVVKLPLKKKLFMESPRSLRMLLFSEETTLPTKKGMEFSSKVVPAAESHGNDNHTEHNYPAKWYETADSEETSSAFSGPITFSGALTYQGLISYSGQVPYSGSISHRSDSSTSTRSFAFPILTSDWNSSPVKMSAPDPRFYRRQRKWHLCFCCSRPSTLFD